MRPAALALAAVLLVPVSAPAQSTADPPEAALHARGAETLAGEELKGVLFQCKPQGGGMVREMLTTGHPVWLEPARVFDNLYYVGTRFVGTWVLKTSGGLILFDSGGSIADASDRITPGLRKLGLDPATIRYVVVTHGHWDHYGGAPWFQKTFGARVVLSEPDWKLMEAAPPISLERAAPGSQETAPIPSRDMVAVDGQKLTLGDATVTLLVTPGHTPGTISALIPVRDGGRERIMSLMGGTAFPPIRAGNMRTGGLLAFDASVQRLGLLSARAGADGVINAHLFADGGLEKLTRLAARRPGQPHPFVIGSDLVSRYYAVVDSCLKAAIARPERTGTTADPFPEPH